MKFIATFLLALIFWTPISYAGSKVATLSATAEDTFSDEVALKGLFNISLSGTWAATVYLQRSFDNGSTWNDVDSFTENVENIATEPESGVLYRIGVKAGGYTSGTVVGRISQ